MNMCAVCGESLDNPEDLWRVSTLSEQVVLHGVIKGLPLLQRFAKAMEGIALIVASPAVEHEHGPVRP
jgi:hypothetical protein